MTDTVGRPLVALPKAHLHLHLEGAMRPSTLAELADRYGMAMPEVSGFGSFTAFADMYVGACAVLRADEDLVRLIDEVVDDAAEAGAVWVEPAFYQPRYRDRLGSDERILELFVDAMAAAEERTGVGVGLMVAADRTQDPAEAVAQARLAARFADRGVVSFGLANDEAIGPPEPFAEAYAIAREAGLLATPHAGELLGPESVIGALDALGADRIQHGVRAVEDPALVARLAADGICLDVCPTSNLALSVVPSLAEHPLPALLDAGVRCSVNADDPLLFGPGLLEEYELCREEFGFDDATLAAIAATSIEASGASAERKAAGRAGVQAWLDAPRGTDMSVQVLTETHDQVRIVTINRPAARNAVDGTTAALLADAFRAFDGDDTVSVAVLTGSGGTFCAGADLKAVATDRGNRVEADVSLDGPMGPTRMLLAKPVIAAVEGFAVAGGLELALWCDLRVAASDAVFGVYCRRWGVPLVDGGTIRLPRLIGHSRALDLILTGRGVSGDEAVAMGLVNRSVAPGEALDHAVDLAAEIAALPQLCLRNDRRSSYDQWGLDVADALARETTLGLETIASGETRDGAARFAAGRGRHGEPA